MYDDLATSPAARSTSDGADHAAQDPTESARPPAIGEDRSPNAWVCPFLRSIDGDGLLGLPSETPDPANRCAALQEAVPQSLRQQELVCLTSGHVNCPRYLRGSYGPNEPLTAPPRALAAAALTPAIMGALALFAAAFLISLAFVVSNGGLALPIGGSTPTDPGSAAGVVTGSPSPSPSPTSTPTPQVTPVATPLESPIVTPIPTPTAAATASPTATPTTKPLSNRYALLKPCPDEPNCYIYIIRSGDNLASIANYFGVPLSTVKALNPWTATGLKVGRELRLPPPTR